MTTPETGGQTAPRLDSRAQDARTWALAQLRLGDEAGFEPASADASFRRYFRIRTPDASWIVMDAPPEREDTRPFVEVAALLAEAGLHAPRVLAQQPQAGYLLLTDLGRQTYLDVLDDANADAMMKGAIDALIRWQQSSRPGVLPQYDEALLQRELDLFEDWFVARHLQVALSPEQRQTLQTIQRLLVDAALEQPRVFVHRDYMPRNLMVSEPSPGVIDFQDAVEGPITYDLVSLLRDAFLSWPSQRVEAWMHHYWERARAEGLPVHDTFPAFRRAADLMGLQRHLKVIGIFARIRYRDGKPHYLEDVPRFVAYVHEVASRYPETQPLSALFDALGLKV